MSISFKHLPLKAWFLSEKRELPWRDNPSPYAVWVSEVMLQQTQVAVVVPYFLRWMETFPTIKSLAEASLDEVIKLWEGLGYYSRARNLHEGAKYVLQHFGGVLPSQPTDLAKIKGLGPYTVGAICSFAFHQKAPAVDGNVIRVLSRYYAIEDDIAKPKTIKSIWNIAQELLPDEEPWIINEALIELGATVCSRKPKCAECPLKGSCLAYRHGKTESIPYKSSKVETVFLHRAVAVIQSENSLLVRRGGSGEIMADLHEFPYFETDSKGMTKKALIKKLQEWGLEVVSEQTLENVKHSFTRYQVTLYPTHLQIKNRKTIEGFQWISKENIKKLAFSSGHRRIIEKLNRE